MNKTAFLPHITALSAIFILGNGVINFPLTGANEFSFISFLLSAVLLAGIYSAFSFLWNKFNVTPCSDLFLKCIYTVAILAVGIFALFSSAECFLDLTSFIAKIILPATPKFFIAVLFGWVIIYFSLKPKESLLKFSLVSIVLVTAVVLFFFIAPMDKYDLRNIFIFRLPKLEEVMVQGKPYFINPLLHSIILPVYLKLELGQSKTKQGFLGVVLGSVLLGLCILSPILLFGSNVCGSLEFPFSSAVSTVTVGRLFTRLDGFAYFVYFVCALIKITVCVRVAFMTLRKISKLIDKN